MSIHVFIWGTEHEKTFIDRLGSWSKFDHGFEDGRRLRLLVNYRASIFKRRNWGYIIAGEVLAYVDEQIQREQ